MVKKLIDIDEEIWFRFRSFCVKNRFKTGDALTDIMEKFLIKKKY